MHITLCEFDVGIEWNRYQFTELGTEVTWVNYAPGVYVTNFSGTYAAIEATYFNGDYTNWLDNLALSSEIAGEITRVGSVFADNIRLPNAGGLAALLALTEGGFFYDDGDELLYIRTPGNYSPGLFKIVAGQAVLISQTDWKDEENQRIYDPDLISVPAISKTIDPLFFGKLQYNDATITIQNRHGEYDLFADFDVYGQEVRIIRGDSDTPYSRFRRIWTGYIDDFTLSEDSVDIRCSDRRKLLERPIPTSFFNQTTYINLDDRDVGKPIPVAYGKVVNINPMCVDKALDRTVAADYTFVLCDVSNHDGITSVQEVRYKGEVITPVTTTVATATIILDDADLEDANGRVDFRDIEVDFTGVETGGSTVENGLDVIVDLIDNFANIPYSNARYVTSTWNSVTTSMPNIGLYLDKDSTVAQQIERIASSLRIQFDVTGDGRFTVRKFDPEATPRFTVRPDEMFGPIRAEYSSDEFASRLNIAYVGGILRYTDEEATIIERYKTAKPADFETVLTSEADAEDFAEDIIGLAKDFPPLISVTVPIENRQPNIEDNVYAILNRLHRRWFGRVLCRIEGITYNFDDNTLTLDLRGFERVEDEGIIIYSQGFAYGPYGYDTIGYGPTSFPEITEHESLPVFIKVATVHDAVDATGDGMEDDTGDQMTVTSFTLEEI